MTSAAGECKTKGSGHLFHLAPGYDRRKASQPPALQPFECPAHAIEPFHLRLPTELPARLGDAELAGPAEQGHAVARDMRRPLEEDCATDYLREKSGPEGEPKRHVPRAPRQPEKIRDRVEKLT